MNFLTWALIVVGITAIVTRGSIFRWFRNFFDKVDFLACPLCVGFWAGIFVECPMRLAANPAWNVVLSGLASSAICWVAIGWRDSIDVVK